MSTATLATFSPGELSKQLSVHELEVRRAIARGKLKAARPRPDAEWIVTPNTAERFVEAGMPGLVAPHLIDGELSRDDVRKAEELPEAIRAAAKIDGVFLSDADAQQVALKELKRPASGVTIDRDITATTNIANVLKSPVPTSAFAPKSAQESRYASWAQLYLVGELWRVLPGVVREQTGKRVVDEVAELYRGPDEFKAITAAVTEAMLSRFVTLPQRFNVERPDNRGTVVFTIYHRLSHREILRFASGDAAKLVDLAF